jgi:hypothetical protein
MCPVDHMRLTKVLLHVGLNVEVVGYELLSATVWALRLGWCPEQSEGSTTNRTNYGSSSLSSELNQSLPF